MHPRFVCGDEHTCNYRGIFIIMRFWKMDRASWINIYGTNLCSGDEKDRQNIAYRTAIFKSNSVRCVYVVWSVLLYSRTRYASISPDLYLDELRLFGLRSFTVCDHIITSLYLSWMKNQHGHWVYWYRWVGNGPPRRQRTLEQRYLTVKSDIE